MRKKFKSIKYSEYDLQFIRNNYPIRGSKYCAKKLNRSENAVNKKIKKMGLKIIYKYEYIDGNGYLRNCKDRNNRYLVHRKIMEDYLKRKLLFNEIVHHIDGNKLNNDIDNLKVVSRGEHMNIHRKDLNKSN